MSSYAEARLFPVDIEPIEPTDFGAFVTDILARSTRENESNTIDQKLLQKCLSLASSFLMTDITMDPANGVTAWSTGLGRLVDLIVVLHKRDELELDTLNCASRACSESWTATGNWRGMDECRKSVREVGQKLQKLLDPNERTYKGERVYAPG